MRLGNRYDSGNQRPEGCEDTMPDLLAGTTILAQDTPPTLKVEEEANETGISSTTYIPGDTECSGTFTASTTGRAKVDFSARLAGDNTNATRLSFELYEGSDTTGTLIQSASDAIAVDRVGGRATFRSNFYVVTGLTPGVTHFIRTMHRVLGGTGGEVIRRQIDVYPAT